MARRVLIQGDGVRVEAILLPKPKERHRVRTIKGNRYEVTDCFIQVYVPKADCDQTFVLLRLDDLKRLLGRLRIEVV